MSKKHPDELKITVKLHTEILKKLMHDGYLEEYIDCSTMPSVRRYRSTRLFNDTILDMIVRRWG
jgi:hypothetical protein